MVSFSELFTMLMGHCKFNQGGIEDYNYIGRTKLGHVQKQAITKPTHHHKPKLYYGLRDEFLTITRHNRFNDDPRER